MSRAGELLPIPTLCPWLFLYFFCHSSLAFVFVIFFPSTLPPKFIVFIFSPFRIFLLTLFSSLLLPSLFPHFFSCSLFPPSCLSLLPFFFFPSLVLAYLFPSPLLSIWFPSFQSPFPFLLCFPLSFYFCPSSPLFPLPSGLSFIPFSIEPICENRGNCN